MAARYKVGTETTATTGLPIIRIDGSAAPTASFTQTLSGTTATFTASTNPTTGILRYDWDFGDGTTGSGATITKKFGKPGSFVVTLTVTDTAYRKRVVTNTVVIRATIADYFDRANNTSTLGTAADGTTSKTWAVLPSGSTFGINSNMAKPMSGTATAIAYVDTGVAGGTVQADVGALQMDHNRTPLLVCRFVDMSNFWFVQLAWLTTGFSVRLLKKVGGTNTTLYTNDISVMAGDTIKVTDSNNVVRLYINDVLVYSVGTDTSLNTATKVGIGSNYANDTVSGWDNFAYWAN